MVPDRGAAAAARPDGARRSPAREYTAPLSPRDSAEVWARWFLAVGDASRVLILADLQPGEDVLDLAGEGIDALLSTRRAGFHTCLARVAPGWLTAQISEGPASP